MTNNKYILSKGQLVNYIKEKHLEVYNQEVTPLKLQKSLYLLWGYWILEEVTNKKSKNLEDITYLFPADFKAGIYGPLDMEVYNSTSFFANANEDIIAPIKEFIDYKLYRIFKVSDFNLVCIVRKHDCWKDFYDNESDKYNNITEDIIATTFMQFLEE